MIKFPTLSKPAMVVWTFCIRVFIDFFLLCYLMWALNAFLAVQFKYNVWLTICPILLWLQIAFNNDVEQHCRKPLISYGIICTVPNFPRIFVSTFLCTKPPRTLIVYCGNDVVLSLWAHRNPKQNYFVLNPFFFNLLFLLWLNC